MNKFSYYMPTQLVFGDGVVQQLNGLVTGNKLLVVCDPFLYNSGVAEEVAKQTGIEKVVYFNDIEPNPSCQTIDKAAALARLNNVNVVIGLGGGSAMDASKMVACLVNNDGSIFDYYSKGEKALKPRKVQLICIPSTAGTGSEVTNIGVYTNKETGIKMPFSSPYFWPDIALVDAALTHTLPAHITAATGMDAFTHAIEAYWSIHANPISDALSLSVIETIINNIEIAVKDPTNKQARENMALASMTAGIAFSQTKTTAIHAVSFPLTVDFGASHGLACSITLPAFTRFIYSGHTKKMDDLVAALGIENIDMFVKRITQILENIGMPMKLRQLGIVESDLEHIVDISMQAPAINFTPIKITKENLYALLKSIL